MAQINKPSDYFQTKLYTGNGTDNHAITGLNFSPSWTWIKNRGGSAKHMVYDAVRGATKAIFTNDTSAENTSSGHLKSFDSNGFTLGDNSGTGSTNGNTETYASWNWLAGGTASSNYDGSITSSVSANQTAGFSIVTATAPSSGNYTVGHGLSYAPEMVWSKGRDSSSYWAVFANPATDTNRKFLQLQETNAVATSGGDMWGAALPTSSVVGLSAGNSSPANEDFVLYCFHSVKGYSKIGSYQGNNSSSGTFLYLGFSPAFILIKDITSTDPWIMLDNKRSSINVANHRLFPNTNGSENTSDNVCDFLSNGIKFRSSNDGHNGSRTYIYYAVAEQPLVGTNNIPATAR